MARMNNTAQQRYVLSPVKRKGLPTQAVIGTGASSAEVRAKIRNIPRGIKAGCLIWGLSFISRNKAITEIITSRR